MQRRKIAEGKTKIIWGTNTSNEVHVQSKDDITAGDGARRDTIAGKAQLSTATTINCFRRLERAGIPTHFLHEVDDTTFCARAARMIPVECVTRRIATGSYLRRNPDTTEGEIFQELVLEMFYKDDARHDPLMTVHPETGSFILYDAGKPLGAGCIGSIGFRELFGEKSADWCRTTIKQMLDLTRETFLVLEESWARIGVSLVDLKIEFGLDPETGALYLADVIDNDSWRIWPGGDKAQMKDKQVYRDARNRGPKELGAIKENYAWVAEQTARFSL